jgi:two-component system sensor histidine kinase CreC
VLFSWWIASSLSRLRGYANAVSRGERAPLPVLGRLSGSTEFSDLASALERMRLQLEDKAYVERYVHTLTHELKSPLAAIRGAAELLQESLPEEDRKRFAHNIQTQEQRLTETIDKLLALAEVEQHGWLQKLEPVNVASLLTESGEDVSAKLAASGVVLLVDVHDQQATVQGDPYLLRQAVSNLLDNAIAFSPSGGTISLSGSIVDRYIEIRVADEGPGVPDYARDRVFERFYSLARPSTGLRSSGLGLPFVREVARLHGGEAELTSLEAGGALATLRLPKV